MIYYLILLTVLFLVAPALAFFSLKLMLLFYLGFVAFMLAGNFMNWIEETKNNKYRGGN